MHIPSARVQNQMANEAAFLWFVPALGSDSHAILIKAPTNVLKSIVKDGSLEFAFGITEIEGIRYLSVAARIHDDPVSPFIIIKAQRVTEEHNALFEILNREETPIFFFDELSRCVSWGDCTIEATERQKVLEAINDPKKLYVGNINGACNAALDCFELTIDPSTQIQGAKTIPIVFATGKVQNISGIIISAIGVGEAHNYEITTTEEGGGQEVNAWHVLESIFPLGIVKSPVVEEGTKERELTDIFCYYELGICLVESKALSIYVPESTRSTERKIKVIHKHIRKALSQLKGALNSIRKGRTIKTSAGLTLEFNRNIPPHCIILVTELLQFGDWDEIVNECLALVREFNAMIHILDVRELVALVAFSKSKEAFDYNLMERFRTFAQKKSPFIRGIPKPDAT